MSALVLALVISSLPAPAQAVEVPPVEVPRIKQTRSARLVSRLDLGGLLGASWFVPSARQQMEATLWSARDALRGEARFEVQRLVVGVPVVGPWVLASDPTLGGFDRGLLITSGVLQLVGFSVGLARLVETEASTPTAASGPVLTFSPISAGRLGLSVKLAGF